MRVKDYGPAVNGLLKDFAEILHERDRLTVQLAERLAAIRAICRVPGEKGPKPPDISTMEQRIWQPRPSLSYAIESLLRNSAHSWTPVQVRDALLERGYDLRKYSLAMAAVHTTLKALVEGSRRARRGLQGSARRRVEVVLVATDKDGQRR
jgi:hypothetical protein